MEVIRGITIVMIALFSMFVCTIMPAQVSSKQLFQMIQTTNVAPPAGSFDHAGDIGMAADVIGRTQFADIYSGIALTEQGSHVNIYLTKMDPQAEKAIIGSAPADKFTFIMSPHTEKQMQDFHQKMIAKVSTLQANGIDIVLFGPDVKTGKESIEVENLTPSEAAYLNSLFGSKNIEVRNATSIPINFDFRSSDSPSWNGGGSFNNGYRDSFRQRHALFEFAKQQAMLLHM